MSKFLQFIDDVNDSVTYPVERLLSMSCAADETILMNFESSVGGSTGTEHDVVTLTLVSPPARATITITDYTKLNAGDKVNLIATDTTNYDFVQGDQSSVAGTFEATTSNDQTATNLMNVINTSSGPSGTRFTATVSGATVTATQATGGTNSNTTVTLTDPLDGMSKTNFTDGVNADKVVMKAIVDVISNSPEDLVVVADDVKYGAVGTLEIVDLGNDTTNIEHLHGTDGFTIISTDSTSKEYIFDKNNALGATGTADAEGVVIQVNGMSSATQVADQVKIAIEHSNGHDGKILVERRLTMLELIQNTTGRKGNTAISGGSSKAATATITITDYTELNAGDKVNLVATDGSDYDFVQGDQSSVAGTFEATTSNDQTATNLMNVINTSSGPSGTRFTATVDGAVVTATQATISANGNTTVTLTDSGAAGMTKTNFVGGRPFSSQYIKFKNLSGGTDGTYVHNHITACAITLDS